MVPWPSGASGSLGCQDFVDRRGNGTKDCACKPESQLFPCWARVLLQWLRNPQLAADLEKRHRLASNPAEKDCSDGFWLIANPAENCLGIVNQQLHKVYQQTMGITRAHEGSRGDGGSRGDHDGRKLEA